MATARDDFLLKLLQACAERAPAPLYPGQYAKENGIDRDTLDVGLDELRRRGLIQLTDWVKDLGQGRALTEAGQRALASRDLAPAAPEAAYEVGGASGLTTYERGEVVRAVLQADHRPYAAWSLVIVNVLFFLYGGYHTWTVDRSVKKYFADGDSLVLFHLGALWPPVTVPDVDVYQGRPELERLLLFLFLHAGMLHLLMNMFFLAGLGREIEAMWGVLRFLAIYFVAGIVSGCVIILISNIQYDDFREIPPTVGASGPLYGVAAALIVWFSLNYQHLPNNFVSDYSRSIGGMLLVLVLSNFWPHVSWQGHFGGAVGGLLAALLLHAQRFHPSRGVRILALLAVPLIPAAFLLATMWQAGWF